MIGFSVLLLIYSFCSWPALISFPCVLLTCFSLRIQLHPILLSFSVNCVTLFSFVTSVLVLNRPCLRLHSFASAGMNLDWFLNCEFFFRVLNVWTVTDLMTAASGSNPRFQRLLTQTAEENQLVILGYDEKLSSKDEKLYNIGFTRMRWDIILTLLLRSFQRQIIWLEK